MARFHGRQGTGALRRYREQKRIDAELQAEEPTVQERTKAYRLGPLPTSGADTLPRTQRSIIHYRETFRASHDGFYPEETQAFREARENVN